MKSTHYFLIVFLLSSLLESNRLIAQYDSLFVDGRFRTYLVHTPQGYSGLQKLPVVLALHGGFGNAFNMQNQSQLSVQSDQEHFIVVYPEGVKGGFFDIRTWNAGTCCGHAAANNIDDVGFMSALIDHLVQEFMVDEERLYLTGMSNGGYMAYRLACELSERVAAIAPVACSMTVNQCSPSSPVPIIHFHSFLDENVLFDGGFGMGASIQYSPPLDSIFSVWGNENQCLVTNDTIDINNEFTQVNWDQCDCNTRIQYFITQDGGHSWPGGQATPMGDPVSTAINANDEMWDFFQQYKNECIPTRDGYILTNDSVEILPNPAAGLLNIMGDLDAYTIRVLDQTGTVIEQLIPSGTEIVLDISQLPQGLYLISVVNKTNQSVSVQNIIKLD